MPVGSQPNPNTTSLCRKWLANQTHGAWSVVRSFHGRFLVLVAHATGQQIKETTGTTCLFVSAPTITSPPLLPRQNL